MRYVATHKSCLQVVRALVSKNVRIGFTERSVHIKVRRWRPWQCTYSKIQIHIRGAKSRATVQLKDLPQGVLESEHAVREKEDDGPAYPMMIQQARNNMRKFADCVLLTRVGGFYEVNLEVSHLLVLNLINS